MGIRKPGDTGFIEQEQNKERSPTGSLIVVNMGYFCVQICCSISECSTTQLYTQVEEHRRVGYDAEYRYKEPKTGKE